MFLTNEIWNIDEYTYAIWNNDKEVKIVLKCIEVN